MTGRPKRAPRSVVDEVVSTPEGAQGLAAARLSNEVMKVLLQAVKASGLSQRELAARVGVSEARVSQILNGDGNIRVAAVARYLNALGYTAQISAEAHTDKSLPSLPIPPRKRVKRRRTARSPEPFDPAVLFSSLYESSQVKKQSSIEWRTPRERRGADLEGPGARIGDRVSHAA
ncbi:helix-turn-helix domain-containing protein [Gordonia alkanivorans]|uniref:helix-turn-helix domain-containing protein n=1 Tax=Gordonia alkanivorans TaxID=84096 RepID=UPI0009DD5ED3